jgi:hypothetical protein
MLATTRGNNGVLRRQQPVRGRSFDGGFAADYDVVERAVRARTHQIRGRVPTPSPPSRRHGQATAWSRSACESRPAISIRRDGSAIDAANAAVACASTSTTFRRSTCGRPNTGAGVSNSRTAAR